jgi:hypothetical protein
MVEVVMEKVKAKSVKAKVKRFRGNPATGGEWFFAGDVGRACGVGWELYARPVQNGWRNMKLVSTEPCAHKANYWLGWNGERLASTKDQKTMDAGKPELREKLMEFLERTPGL